MSSYARRVNAVLSMIKGVQYMTEVRFVHCRYKKPLPFDFFVASHVLLIEVDGEFHENEECKRLRANDKIKNEFCERNGIPLLRINFRELKKMDDKALRVHIQTFLNNARPQVPERSGILGSILPQGKPVTFSYIHWNIVVLILNVILFIVNFKA